MFFIHWLSRTSRRSHSPRQPNRDRTKERRLKLLRLEQRRVLNADFTFVAHGLNLDHVDGDLTVREVSGGLGSQIEFDLAGGSIWQDNGSTGLFAIDNSSPDHSILSIAKSDLESLSSGVSLHAASSDFDLQFDVQSSALDLSQMHGTLVADGFGEIQQTAANDHDVRLGEVSLSADRITLSQFHGDDITLNANEIDLTGGANSFAGSTLSIHSAATPSLELGGTSDRVHELNFTDSDITALDASFHRISFEATSADAASSIHVDSPGADFNDAITPGHDGSLHLTADSVQIDGVLSISGGLIDVTATNAATISATGSLINHGGEVHVDAGESGTLLDSGRVDVSNSEPGGIGGTVYLLGEQVGLFGSAEVDASGHSGGGEVLIGGDLHGDNAAIHHAAQTFIGDDVEIHADALLHGDGGQVVVWSDEVTQVYGALTARGGALLGDGGLIETSSHNQLIVTRGGDASAAHGDAGTWLLDPLSVKIVAVRMPPPDVIFGVTEFATPPFFTPTISGSEVTDEAIEEQLNAGTTVVISTFNPDGLEAGDVTQEVSIDVNFTNAGDSATFIISAANDTFINGGFTVIGMSGSLNVLLEANTGADDLNDASGNVTINASIDTNGGLFSSTGVDFTSTTATINASGGVSINHTGTVNLGVINTGMGIGGTAFLSGAIVNGMMTIGEGNVLIDGGNDGDPDGDNDDLRVLANITATETIFLLADRDVIVQATVTVGAPSSPLNPSSDLFITADANSDGVGGFMLDEAGSGQNAQLQAGGNISIVGAALVATAAANDSLVIAGDGTNPQIVAGQDLTLVANFGNVSGAGDIVIDGKMEATGGALTAFFTGKTFLSADQSAGTDLLFQNAVRLTNNVTLSAGNNATFASTVLASTLADDGVDATGSALTVTGPANTPLPGNMPAGGDILFVGMVGGMPDGALDSLIVNGDGLIDFLNSINVDGDINVMATSETGRVTFQDAVTTTAGSVTITNAGLLVTSSSAQFNVATNFTQDGAGSTELGAGIKTTNGDVSFTQGVLLTRAQQPMPPDPPFNPLTTIDTSAGNGNINFGGTIDSEVAGANEEQTISLTNLTGSSFTISWDPPNPPGTTTGAMQVIEMTADIPAGASAEMVKTALVALPSLAAEDIDVTGDAGGPFTLTFRGAFRGTDVNPVTVAGTGLNADAVLTTVEGRPIVAEHNPLTLIAGTGEIEFQGNIGAGFEDVGLGVDGDQSLGDLLIESADKVTFTNVTIVATDGRMNFGSVSAITNGIDINDTVPADGLNPISLQSQQNFRINGNVTSNVDLTLSAAGNLTLTENANINTTASNSNVSIFADIDGNAAGAFRMAPPTMIDAGSGFIDVRAVEVFLGKLTTTSTNSTAAENPAIRVIATFGGIHDINGGELNLSAPEENSLDGTRAGVVLDAVLGIGSEDDLETDLAELSAFNHDLAEQQMVTLLNATGGTFRLSWNPPGTTTPLEFTDPIPFNATADQVKAEFLKTFASLSAADLEVSGNAGGPYILKFAGALQVTNVDLITAENVNLVGINPSIIAETIAAPQTITLANATGGTFTITWDPPGTATAQTTDPIRFDATAAEVQAELVAKFASLTDGNIDVTGGAEVQTISLANTTGGDFTISWDPPGTPLIATTAAIAFDATAAEVEDAFVAAVDASYKAVDPSLEFTDADIDVTGNPGGPFTLTFRGAFQGAEVNQVTTDDSGLLGAGAATSVLTTEQGGPFRLNFVGDFSKMNVATVTTAGVGLGPDATVTPTINAGARRAENNIVLRDVGTEADHRVDLTFVHNEANQVAAQFASTTVSFASADADKNNPAPPLTQITSKITEITFSAATPGQSSDDIVINFTKSQHNVTTTPPSANTIGVPVITVTGHTINIDLDIGEDTVIQNGILDPGEDANNNGNLDGTTANALRDAINSNHAANQLIRAQITKTDPTSDSRAPGTDDVTLMFNSIPILAAPSLTPIRLSPAGVEDGVININVENGSLRVVADNSRLVLSEMQRGIDTFDPPDLAVAAVQSENTIKLTADTIEVFDDILAISAKTQVSTPTFTQATAFFDNAATTVSVVDTTLLSAAAATQPLFIQINSEILRVTSINTVNNTLTVMRAQNGTLATAHQPGPIIVPFDGGATKLTVVDSSVFRAADGSPINPGFFIRIDSETLRVTNINFANNELTVDRGVNSTAATSHVPGTVIADISAIQPSTTLGTVLGVQTPNATPLTTTTPILLTVANSTVFGDDDNNPATPFIPATPILVQIESEVFAVTRIAGNQLTALRGQNGTAATAHAAGALVTQVGADTGIRQYIEINARANFVLGADRVISTDDHYLNSLNVAEDLSGNGKLDPAEPFTDTNGNGKFDPGEPFTDSNGNAAYDVAEDFNRDGVLQFNNGEDVNRNGVLDLSEDANGNGILDLRGNKPATTLNDDFFSQINHDVIHITADSTFSGTNGEVLLGLNSTISTDNGIEQLIAPRPNFTGIQNGVFTFDPGTAFFSGDVVVSNFTSRFLFNGDEVLPDGTTLPRNSVVFLGTMTFTIGAPGEKNLVLDIDWGDHDRTLISEIPPVTVNTVPARFDATRNVYVFDPVKDQHATRYLIPEGGASYSIPHEFSQAAFNLTSADGQAINQPGRGIGVTSDPIQVRFAVSQHSSIVIDGQAVLNPRAPADPAAVPENAIDDIAPTGRGVNFPYLEDNPTLTQADPLFQLSSTNVLDQPDVFLPRFDNGRAGFAIPTPPSVPIPPADVVIPPPALPSAFIPNALIIATPQITTESSRSSAATSSVTTDEYFELRRTNEDGTVTAERLNERAGESLLNREQFEDFVRELGDGEYEIFFITRDNKDGTTIPRSVIQFRLESGRLAPPANDSPILFKPFKLIPVPKDPPVQPVPPNKPNPNGAAADKNPDASDDGIQKPSDDEMSALPLHERHSDTDFTLSGTALAAGESFAVSGTALAAVDSFPISGTALAAGESTIESDTSNSSETAPMAVGLLLVAGTRWRKNRFNPFGTSLFSKTARLTRKRVAVADDQ